MGRQHLISNLGLSHNNKNISILQSGGGKSVIYAKEINDGLLVMKKGGDAVDWEGDMAIREAKMGFSSHYINSRIFNIQRIRCSDTFIDCWLLSYRANVHCVIHLVILRIIQAGNIWNIPERTHEKLKTLAAFREGSWKAGDQWYAFHLINSEWDKYNIYSKEWYE